MGKKKRRSYKKKKKEDRSPSVKKDVKDKTPVEDEDDEDEPATSPRRGGLIVKRNPGSVVLREGITEEEEREVKRTVGKHMARVINLTIGGRGYPIEKWENVKNRSAIVFICTCGEKLRLVRRSQDKVEATGTAYYHYVKVRGGSRHNNRLISQGKRPDVDTIALKDEIDSLVHAGTYRLNEATLLRDL